MTGARLCEVAPHPEGSWSTQRGSNPPRRLGRPVPMPIGHACRESRAGVEPGIHRVATGGLAVLATSTRESERARESVHHRMAGTAGPRKRGRESNTQSNGVTVRYRSGTFAFTARCAEPLHYGHHQLRARGQESNQATATRAQIVWCPGLESNQRLLRFTQAPSPDRLPGHRCGRGGARPRASSTILFSKSAFVAQRLRSGTRTRTSTYRVKACWPAISRSPIGRGPAGSRTPFARVRTECFAVKASDPYAWVPSVGLEPTHAGLKGRYPTSWVTTANARRHFVWNYGSNSFPIA